MPWLQYSVTCTAQELDLVESILLDLGAASISITDARDEPIYEPMPGDSPLWQYSIITGLFDTATEQELLYQQIATALPPQLAAELEQSRLADQDWEQAYKQHFQPIQFSQKLWVVPSWCDLPDPKSISIRLDPGMAFGTGSHPTTALCMAWLAEHAEGISKLIDYGCGSGILAIAACKLGVTRAIAVDIDPQALTATRLNAEANDIKPEQIQISLPEKMTTDKTDLLVANILAGPLIEFAPKFAALVRPGGQILLSGILKLQLDDIISAYQSDFELDAACFRDDWVSISGTKN